METTATAKPKRKRRAPRAWLIENGVRKELVVPEPEKIGPLGEWMLAHPNGWGEAILDMRAILK